ncbi:MAG: tetratricopeptide repeat protein, partial [candidate division Zixibacteria bacterium]|nr:tetratricopeptide repeat protein [candidate division Zixibacteria bacterium]
MIGKTISHYKILNKLGEGGMGVVYKAQDIQLQRPVALKFLPPHIADSPEEKARFIREAQSASSLNHPNVTTIYGIEDTPEGVFIVMEYVEGKTLRQIIEEKPFSIKKTLEIGIQICEGLAAAHEKGIVHRDIKSANIMLTSRGQVKIMDFGLAKISGADQLTETSSTLGTTAYMSPEQASGEETDQRSDIFSFGVVLYELLTDQLPFGGEHSAAIIYSLLNEEPQPISQINNRITPEFERIVSKALAKNKEERYQHIDDLLADLRREKKSLDYTRTIQIPHGAAIPKPKRKLLPFLIPASLVFILVLFFLILNPFKVEIGTQKGAVAEENTLAIMYFENLKDKEDKAKIGEMVSELLITDLSESQYMRVVSSQRLYDIFKLMGREGVKVIDKTVASEVARRAQAKYMLLGKILSTEPELLITSQLVDVESGNVVASQRISGPDGVNIFTLVDSLSGEIKKDLMLPLLAKKEEEKPIADITTHSPEALKLYLEGNELSNKLYMKEAAERFEKAVTIDTTFASAYLRLAVCYSSLQEGVKARAFAETAFKLSDRVSRKEKFLIEAYYFMFQAKSQEAKKVLEQMVELYPDEKIAYENLAQVNFTMNNLEEAIAGYGKVIELDSLSKGAYNMLAYTYDKADRYDEAIRTINKYIEIAPDEANPYDSRGDIYAHHNEVNEAIESYNKALEKKPDFEASIEKLGLMYLYKREYDKAESYFQKYGDMGTKTARSISRADLVLVPLYQGKYNRALKLLDQGIIADDLDGLKMQQAEKYLQKALIYMDKKDFEKSLQAGKKIIEIIKGTYPENLFQAEAFYGILLVASGKLDSALEISNKLKSEITDKSQAEKSNWYILEYMIKYQQKQIEQALEIAKLDEKNYDIIF